MIKQKELKKILEESGITDKDSWESYFRKMRGEGIKKLVEILFDDE